MQITVHKPHPHITQDSPFRDPLTNQPGTGNERANPINNPGSTGPRLERLLPDVQHRESPVFLKHHYTD